MLLLLCLLLSFFVRGFHLTVGYVSTALPTL